jgi:hypothetical protein
MSEPENFLSRWARLKREAAEAPGPVEATEVATPVAGADAAAEASRAAEPADEAKASPSTKPLFDITKLPPIETITATTDIRAFLAPGVPPELARAALRRAWVADPAIRDFIGIAENQWDFNDPDSIPGFGSFGPLDDVRRLVAQVIGDPLDPSEVAAAPAEEISAAMAPDSGSIAADVQESAATEGDLSPPEDPRLAGALSPPKSGSEPAATQQLDEREQPVASVEMRPRRQHGGALPQ